jgi:periplasmic copper chaperone A
MTKSIWAALALAAAALVPTACSETPEQAETAPDAPDGITVANGRLMLPAVKGNPGAVYFDVKNDSDRNLVVRAVSVAGAGSSEMHTKDMQMMLQATVPPKGSTAFEPGGQHVMAMDLADTVAPGSQAEVTVTFVGGDKVSFPAEVRAAGDER